MKIIAGAFLIVVLGAGAWAATVWLSPTWGVAPKVITGHVEVIDGVSGGRVFSLEHLDHQTLVVSAGDDGLPA